MLHVGFRSGPRNKETCNPSFRVYSTAYYVEAVTKSCSVKKMLLLPSFNLCKASVKGLYFNKIASFFPATFLKMNTVTGTFQKFYLDFK